MCNEEHVNSFMPKLKARNLVQKIDRQPKIRGTRKKEHQEKINFLFDLPS